MRRLILSWVVAATAALVPTWALAGNQEVAEQIAVSLKESGQMQGYKIGVKFQDGTAWLRGQVNSADQMNTALRIAFQTPGVTRVVNNLSIAGQEAAQPAPVPSTATPPMPTAQPVQPIQPVQGALAAEQTPRPVSRTLLGLINPTAKQEPSAPPAAPMPQPSEQRVATAYLQVPTQPTAAPRPTTPVAFNQPMMAPSRSVAMADAVAPAIPVAPVPPAVPVVPATPTPALPRDATPLQPIPAVPAPPATPVPATSVVVPTAPAVAGPMPTGVPGAPLPMAPAAAPMRFDQANLPNYAWPAYSAYPNYAALTYPKQYSPTAWPYIGPFYPYPQVPLGWRKVSLEWSDGWWFLDFDDGTTHGPFTGLFRNHR